MGELYSVGMAAEPVGGLVEVGIVGAAVERPEGSNTGGAAADDRNLLPAECVNRHRHRQAQSTKGGGAEGRKG